MVPGSAVPEVRVRDQAELFEELQRAVDGRDVHAPGGLLDIRADLLGGGVLQLGHGFQDQLALRSDPVTAGPQLLVPRLRHGARLTPFSRTSDRRRHPAPPGRVPRPPPPPATTPWPGR